MNEETYEPCSFCNNGHGLNKNDYYIPVPDDGIYKLDNDSFIQFTRDSESEDTYHSVDSCPRCNRKLIDRS